MEGSWDDSEKRLDRRQRIVMKIGALDDFRHGEGEWRLGRLGNNTKHGEIGLVLTIGGICEKLLQVLLLTTSIENTSLGLEERRMRDLRRKKRKKKAPERDGQVHQRSQRRGHAF